MFNIAEEAKLVEAITPQAGDALTGAYVSLKNYRKAYVVVHINQANAAQVAITVEMAPLVSGVGHVPIVRLLPIWANEDCATSDTLVREATDAVAFTTSVATTQKLVVFQIDASMLADGYDCITVITAASNAANITSAFYLLVGARYQAATPPTALTD